MLVGLQRARGVRSRQSRGGIFKRDNCARVVVGYLIFSLRYYGGNRGPCSIFSPSPAVKQSPPRCTHRNRWCNYPVINERRERKLCGRPIKPASMTHARPRAKSVNGRRGVPYRHEHNVYTPCIQPVSFSTGHAPAWSMDGTRSMYLLSRLSFPFPLPPPSSPYSFHSSYTCFLRSRYESTNF